MARWIRLRLQPGHDTLYHRIADVKCQDCGIYQPESDTYESQCAKCQKDVRVCKTHKPPPRCLKCSHTELCAVCLDVRKPECLQDAFCATCDKAILVCETHLAEPMCYECIS